MPKQPATPVSTTPPSRPIPWLVLAVAVAGGGFIGWVLANPNLFRSTAKPAPVASVPATAHAPKLVSSPPRGALPPSLLAADAPAPKLMVSALGAQLLKVTGRLADGTILWMTGPTTIAEHSVPIITEAAAGAGRPAPEIVAGFPICVTDGTAEATEEARQRAAKSFAIYGQLPSYRAMLDHEGYDGPADLAIIGGAAEVEDRVRAMEGVGVTTFAASEFGSRGQREATRELLVGMLG